MKGGWVYVMTNKPGGVLYIGVCADVVARVAQHREGSGSAFCRRYNLKRLVHAEAYPTIEEAIAREKAMKEWRRAWKIRQIEEANPNWDDLWNRSWANPSSRRRPGSQDENSRRVSTRPRPSPG